MSEETWVERIALLSRDAGARCRWNAPVTVEALRAFEDRYGIELASDYKRVLSQIGNGAEGLVMVFPLGFVGTDEGLSPLESWGELDLRSRFPLSIDAS